MIERNVTENQIHQCQVVIFRWKYERNIENLSLSELSESTPFDISNYISSVKYNKQMSSPSGQFEIALRNDRDWKKYIKKGCWLMIYMSNEGELAIPDVETGLKWNLQDDSDEDPIKADAMSVFKMAAQKDKLRCIGLVDTVRAQGSVGEEKGEFDVSYVVSGRDIGVVYEETEIWHNQINFDKTLLATANANLNANLFKTVDGLLKVMHQLIFSPDDLVKDLKDDSLTSIALQWLMPVSLYRALGIIVPPFGKTYYGNIPGLLNFKSTPASYPVETPTALINGIAWSQLKSKSIEPYHELYPELDDNGQPQLNFRLQPWRTDFTKGFRYPQISRHADKFADPFNGLIHIGGIDIVDFDVGEDNHSRYNLFWSTINSSTVSIQSALQLIGDNSPKTGFPRVLQNSVRRFGLRMLYSEVNANILLNSEKADQSLLSEFNEFVFDLWHDSHKLESGTIDIVGKNETRLGKCVRVDDSAKYVANKTYYIEGYSDDFIVDSEKGNAFWSQTLFVTRGIANKEIELFTTDKSKELDEDAGEFTPTRGGKL